MSSTNSRFNSFAQLVLTVVISLCTLTAQAQMSEQPSPGAEHQKLASRVGKWNYQGDAKANPFGTVGKFAGVTTYRLVLNGFFLEERWEDKSNVGYVAQGVVLTGYDPTKKSFVDYSFENDGSISSSVVTIDGNNWTSVGSRTDREGKVYKTKWVSSISEDGMKGASKMEYSSDDGKTWLPFFELASTKVSE